MADKTKQDAISSKQFEDALLEGASIKKDIATKIKRQSKAEYERFYETMLDANDSMKEILAKRRKNRTDDDKAKLQKFKADCRKTYSLVCDYMTPEKAEDGKMTKVQKLVDKIASALDVLRYAGCTVLDDEFSKRGISLAAGTRLEDKHEKLKDNAVRANVADIFKTAVGLKQKARDDNDFISTTIYTEKIPAELLYDKDSNNSGLKPGDFRKLVDLKAKQLMASSEEAKAKVEQKIQKAAADKQFEIARAELTRDKITQM